MKWILSILILIATALLILFWGDVSLWIIAEKYTAWLNHLITDTWRWIFVIACYGILIYLFFGLDGVIPEHYCNTGVRYKHCRNLYTNINEMNICSVFIGTTLLTIFCYYSYNAYSHSIAFTQGIMAIIGATITYQTFLRMSFVTILCTVISMLINIFMGLTIWMILMSWGVFGYFVAFFGVIALLGLARGLFLGHGEREERQPYLIAIPYLVLGGIGLHFFGKFGCATGCYVGLLIGTKLYLAAINQAIPHCPRCGNELITTGTSYASDTLYTNRHCYNCGYNIEETG